MVDPDFVRNLRNFLSHADASTLAELVALVCEEYRARSLPGVSELCAAEQALRLVIAARHELARASESGAPSRSPRLQERPTSE